MTFLLDASVSRYRRPLKIRDFVWEIKYWDLRTLNNIKSNFSFNEINKKDTCDIFHCVSVSACRFTVCLFFFWLYCITDCYCLRKTKSRLACVAGVWKGWERRPNFLPLPFRTPATQAKSRLVTSIWQSPGPVATKMPLFHPKFKCAANFFQLPPKTSFSSLRDLLEKSFIISPSNWTICAGLRGTSGVRPVPVTAVALTN